jgi:micrococcal nuclease
MRWKGLARSAVITVLLTSCAGTSAATGTPAPRSPPPDSTGAGGTSGASGVAVPVTKVTDGDTFHVEFQGRDDRVRLIGVDTPEISAYGGHAECFGDEAAAYTTRRLTGRSVGLVFDVNQRDRYGRLLAYVYLGPELINLTLVQLGFATADPVRPDLRMEDEFATAEQTARRARKGMWSACPSPG